MDDNFRKLYDDKAELVLVEKPECLEKLLRRGHYVAQSTSFINEQCERRIMKMTFHYTNYFNKW